jgi:hypothetical protein
MGEGCQAERLLGCCVSPIKDHINQLKNDPIIYKFFIVFLRSNLLLLNSIDILLISGMSAKCLLRENSLREFPCDATNLVNSFEKLVPRRDF